MADDIRVILGDCLDELPSLEADSVDCIVTDPPYGINYKHGSRATGNKGGNRYSDGHIEWPSIEGDGEPDGRWLGEAFRILKGGSALYLVTRWDVEPVWRDLLRGAGFRVVQRLTWHKRDHGKGDLKGTYSPTCEDVLFASKGRHLLNSRPSMLIDVGCVPTWERRFHPHQKPIPLAKQLIEVSTKHGDLVLDPFAGSGCTPIASLKSGRRCIAIETEAHYVDIIHRRLKAAGTPLFESIRP